MAKKVKNKPVAVAAAPSKPVAPKQGNDVNRLFTVRNLCIVLAVISVAVYANTLRNGFVYDDVSVVNGNRIVMKGISAIPEILTTNYRHGFYTTVSNDLYRPLSLVMFATEYQLFGDNPMPFHLMNILLFAGCVIMLFLFFDKFFDGKKTTLSFVAALLFALHPIHTEVVANIKSRDELLCFFFSFLCLNIFMKYVQSGKVSQFLLGTLCFLVALFSKETIITFLAIIPFIFFFYKNNNRQRSIYITIAAVVAGLLFVAVRYQVLTANHANNSQGVLFIDNFLVGAPNAVSRLATELWILGLYLRLLVVPYPLICDYTTGSLPYFSFGNFAVLLSLAAYIGLVVIAVMRFIKDHKDPLAFAIIFFLATLSLFTNIPFYIGTAVGERFLFFPSVGFCMAVALLIEKYLVGQGSTWPLLKQPRALAVIIPVSLIFGVLTISRNADWLDDYTLFSTDIQKMPGNCRFNHNMGIVTKVKYNEEKDPAKKQEILAEETKYFQKALEAYPEYDKSNIELGLIDFNAGRLRDALKLFFTAASQDGSNVSPPFNIGVCYVGLGLNDSAIYFFNNALRIEPGNIDAQLGEGQAYLAKKGYDSAAYYFNKVIAAKPDKTLAYLDLGVVYFNQQKYPEAIVQYKKAIATDPASVDGYSNLGRAYFNTHQYADAVANFAKELQLNVQNVADISFTAYAWQQLGKPDSVKKYQAIAQRLDPNFKL